MSLVALSTGSSAPYGQVMNIIHEGPDSSLQHRLHTLVATGFLHFLVYCKSEWRLGLVTVGTSDLMAKEAGQCMLGKVDFRAAVLEQSVVQLGNQAQHCVLASCSCAR